MAVTIVTRSGKGSPLTHDQVDANFDNLNDGKEDSLNNLPLDTAMSSTADFIEFYDAAAAAVKKITPINSVFFNRTVIMKVLPDSIPTYVGNGISAFTIPLALNGLYLSGTAGDLGAHVYAAGVTGTTDIMLRNSTTGNDMLTTVITIDSGELDSSTAAAAPVVGSNNLVSTADVIMFDIDAVSSGTAANGLEIRMQFKGA
tara:strand:- start:459 stop:1061 length:603 start_codon:yes stop_codon:yes gene_type:complete